MSSRLLWACLLLVVLLVLTFGAALFLFASLHNTKKDISRSLQIQFSVFQNDMERYFDQLAVMGVNLSEDMSAEVDKELALRQMSFAQLNDSPEVLNALEEKMIEPLCRRLRQTGCSGAFVLLDATVNTRMEGAEHSRAGLYVQKSGADTPTVPLLLGISFLCFVFINLIPSDPAEVALRIRQTPIITEELIAQTRAELGLDQPFLVRYAHWLWDCLHFDLGVSYTNPARTVLGEIGRCLPATLELAGLSLVYVIVLSLPIGFLSAVYKDTWFDRIMRGVVFATTAMPVYWVGLLLIWIVSIKLDLLPTSGYGGFSSLILPAFTVALSYISTYIRLIRNNMLENMREDYVLYAQARGLKQRSILVRHILKNSLQSCVTAIGMSIPQLIAGTIVVENVFAWPGVGRLCIASIFNRDYPVIQAYVLLVGVLFVFFNLFFDILQYVADPRLRERKA